MTRFLLSLFLLVAAAARADQLETLQVGKKFQLQATADGNPPPSFEWFRNDVKTLVVGPVFLIDAVTAQDAGSYQVKATNSEGSAMSERYVLTIDESSPPVIAMAPLGARISEGGSLTLSVVATGVPAPSYQWHKNGILIPGATSAKLTFAPITRGDAGSYVVVVTNPKGTATSAAAVVEVLFPPTAPIITRPLSSVVVPKKSDYAFRIETSGEGPISIQWKKGSSVLAGKTGPELLLRNINPSDEGIYSVTVRNAFGSSSSSARLTVLR